MSKKSANDVFSLFCLLIVLMSTILDKILLFGEPQEIESLKKNSE